MDLRPHNEQASETRTILEFLLMPALAAIWWYLFGEDKAENLAEQRVNHDLDMWSVFWSLVAFYAVLLLIATHGFHSNPFW